MSTMICTKCGIQKYLNEFELRKDSGTYRRQCKMCRNNQSKQYYQMNKEHIQENHRNYYGNNKEYLLKKSKEYYYNTLDYQKYRKQIYNQNPIVKERNREKYHNNIHYHVRQNLSKRIHFALTEMKNNQITMKYLGCSIEYFIKWLEFQFYDGMDWSNYGWFWHIDHTIPISAFNFENDFEIMKCFNWVNLRPLRADKNICKSNIVEMREYLFQEIKATKFLKEVNQHQYP